MSITPKDWHTFQHYKDRAPPWIKLHRGLMHNHAYRSLPLASQALAPMLWLLASEYEGGTITDDIDAIAFKLHVSKNDLCEALHPLIEGGWMIEGAEPKSREKWPSRYVSDAIRAEVMARDENKCVSCGSVENLEIDHKIPVSKGGESVPDNLQVLCRSCNRSKRNKSAEQVATQKNPPRSLEGETEERQNAEPSGSHPKNDEAELFDRGKRVLGKDAGGLIAKLLKSKKEVPLARAAIEMAATKQNPREYIGRVLAGPAIQERPLSPFGTKYPDGII